MPTTRNRRSGPRYATPTRHRRPFHLLLVVPTSSDEAKRRAFSDAGVPWNYTIGQAKENARQTAQRVGRDYVRHDSASFTVTGAVGREREAIRKLAGEHDFTGIFVPDRERSLLQRLLGAKT